MQSEGSTLPAMLAILLWVPTVLAAPNGTCPDRILPDTGIGGGGTVTALANVSSQAECCALCHGDYHDECSGWVYGPTPGADTPEKLAKHNCAIMAKNGPPKAVPRHITGVSKDAPPPPPPAPTGKPCNADVDCTPTTATNWRCKQHTASPSAENNCHIPGPYTKGNNTCACTVQPVLSHVWMSL